MSCIFQIFFRSIFEITVLELFFCESLGKFPVSSAPHFFAQVRGGQRAAPSAYLEQLDAGRSGVTQKRPGGSGAENHEPEQTEGGAEKKGPRV